MYTSKGHGVIDPDGHIITPSECAQMLNELQGLRVLIASMNDRAPEVADAVLGGIAMDPAIRAFIKDRIITLLQATKLVSL